LRREGFGWIRTCSKKAANAAERDGSMTFTDGEAS